MQVNSAHWLELVKQDGWRIFKRIQNNISGRVYKRKHSPGFYRWPPHNVVVASDLQPIRQHNQLMKYADDTHVLVASGYIVTAQEKFRIRLIKAT